MKNSIVLKEERSAFISNLEDIKNLATTEERDLSKEENTNVDSLLAKIDEVDTLIERAEKVEGQLKRAAALSGSTIKTSETEKVSKNWSLFKAVNEVRNGGQLSGLEAEMHQEAEKEARKGLQGIGLPSFMTEKRAKDGKSNPVIVGHAAVFNSLSEDLGGFQERIHKNAFDDVLDNDVRAFFNHDPNHLLARTSSGTLKLAVDEKGLKYEFSVPDTSSGRDLLVSMERGDISQSSFAFTIEDDSWDQEDGIDIRTINKVKRLYDVSPVSIPAYPGANDLAVAQRSLAINNETKQRKDEEIDLIKRNLLELNIEILKRKQNEK